MLREHLRSLEGTAPAASRHALDLAGLRHRSLTSWRIWDGKALAGFGALQRLTASHAETKRMRNAATHLRRGVATRLLRRLVTGAAARGYTRFSLETGVMALFAPVHRLYASFDFAVCVPFGDYRQDPNNLFLTLALPPGGRSL